MPYRSNSKFTIPNTKQILNCKPSKIYCLTFIACLAFLISHFLFFNTAHAESLTSPSYRIRFGNFNITSGLKSSTSYSLTDTVGQTAAELFSSAGYSVKAGFQYLYALYDFSFTISDLTIDFGSLTPSSFSTDTNVLTVSAPGQGYSVATFATNRLTNNSGDTIPDTTCNSGTCLENSAGVWTSTSSYGFGYNAAGPDVDSDFVDTTYFRPFPDLSLADSPEVLIQSAAAGQSRSATITYKVNISGSQASGNYSTQIVYIATPVY